jgi:hypothetical protein
MPALVPFGRVLAATITLNPNASSLPGSAMLQQLADGIGWWGLIASLIGLILGAATWGLGSHTNNYQHATTGRRAVLVSGAAALIIGAAPALLNFLFNAGQAVH